MNRLVLADTGPLYALADPSDQYHLRAQTELDRIGATKKSVAVTYPTLAEAYTLILRRLGISYEHQWVQQLMDGSVLINPEPGDYVRAATLILNFQDQSMTLFDAVVATMSQRIAQCGVDLRPRFRIGGHQRAGVEFTPASVPRTLGAPLYRSITFPVGPPPPNSRRFCFSSSRRI